MPSPPNGDHSKMLEIVLDLTISYNYSAELASLSSRLQLFKAGLAVEAWCNISISFCALNDACLSALSRPLHIQDKTAPIVTADNDVGNTVLLEGLLVLQVFNGPTGNVLWHS